MATFDFIFREHYQSLLLYCLKFVEDENDARDIVQEVFVAMWETQKYQLEKSHLKSYLFNAVKNSSLNYLKHKKVIRKYVKEEQFLKRYELEFYKSSEKSIIEKEDLKTIYNAIESLSDNYKEVIVLSRFEGLKNKEIAEKLNIPLRTVETRLFRALVNLRKVLSEKQIYILLSLSLQSSGS